MTIIEPASPEEFETYYLLRHQTLREPWGQPQGSERVEDDATAVHALLLNDKETPVGVCRLHLNTPTEGQLRFMGIRQDQQGKALGNLLLDYMHNRARQLGATTMVLHARDYAVNFYRRNGYEVIEESYLLFGTIQHYKMARQL
ncbi:GNAT family N-acetyltransferase [Pontibacter chitinilyticus]|uniref:GNAT family N-acetyltransferase n=1 Tax=Pontibacter chitinilyticus TaxID=2674989 RepID=UPI003219C78D